MRCVGGTRDWAPQEQLHHRDSRWVSFKTCCETDKALIITSRRGLLRRVVIQRAMAATYDTALSDIGELSTWDSLAMMWAGLACPACPPLEPLQQRLMLSQTLLAVMCIGWLASPKLAWTSFITKSSRVIKNKRNGHIWFKLLNERIRKI